VNGIRRAARSALATTAIAAVATLGVILPATPAVADDEVSATVKQVVCNPDGTASVYWNLHNTFAGEARFDVLRSTQGTLQFTTPPKTYQGNVRYIVLDGGATMVVYVTLVVPSPSVSLETDFYWPTGPEAGFSVTGNPPVQPPANCPKATSTAATRTRTPASHPSSGPATVAPIGASTAASSAAPNGALEGIAGGSPAPELAPLADGGRDRTHGASVAVAVALATFVLLGGGVALVIAWRRRTRSAAGRTATG
jgi:hypothetical protein